jgi:hypothetical protein
VVTDQARLVQGKADGVLRPLWSHLLPGKRDIGQGVTGVGTLRINGGRAVMPKGCQRTQ